MVKVIIVLSLFCVGAVAYGNSRFDDVYSKGLADGWNNHIQQEDLEAKQVALAIHANGVAYDKTHVNPTEKDLKPRATKAKAVAPVYKTTIWAKLEKGK